MIISKRVVLLLLPLVFFAGCSAYFGLPQSDAARALWFGVLTAISLPIGALLGLWCKPSSKIVAGIMAFGAGALIAALTLELVHNALDKSGFVPVAMGIAIGCVAFVFLNKLLDNRGAFLRKSATFAAHIQFAKRKKLTALVAQLSTVNILVNLPPEEIHALIPYVHERVFPSGTVIFHENDFGDSMYFIESGTVDVFQNNTRIATLDAGDTFGEMALITGEPRVATVIVHDDVKTWKIHRAEFDKLVETSPRFKHAVAHLMETRAFEKPRALADAQRWKRDALRNISAAESAPTQIEMNEEAQEHKKESGVATAIVLGTFLDGIPESLVIGVTMIGSAISLPLIGGIFLSNIPESMSSAVLMKRHGDSTAKIIGLWLLLVVISGIAAYIGNVFFANAPAGMHAVCEGIAAGAMLAMIAQTMLPEAYEHSGFLSGLLTVFGFLVAIFLRSLQG